jgi:omega-6 fatty acid desaturase (delta-12 desaturase)
VRRFGAPRDVCRHCTDIHSSSHHIFSSLPHYHAVEATAALRKEMGTYALKDDRNVFSALWQDWHDCVYVAPDDTPGASADVLWFRSDVPVKDA